MNSAERLGFSIEIEGAGVHALLWDDKVDLVKSLILLKHSLKNLQTLPVYASVRPQDRQMLRTMVDSRCPLRSESSPNHEEMYEMARRLWVVFLQQGATKQVGPWLNGWRHPASEAPGSLLVIREADFDGFQRHAPDLASFVGGRIFDASKLGEVNPESNGSRIEGSPGPRYETILEHLPGIAPAAVLEDWIRAGDTTRDARG